MKKILIIGASSAIAQATARLYCAEDVHFYLIGRSRRRLKIVQEDLMARGAGKVEIDPTDPVRLADNQGVVSRAVQVLDGVDLALIAHGELSDQKACETSAEKTIRSLNINAISVISLATLIANHLEERGEGTLVVISSVAGDRGRASNYVYGAAKSCVSTFMEGLSHRLFRTGVSVITVKPGFVDTPMTEQFEKGLLWTQPEIVAEGIKKAIEKRKSTVYLPWYWRWIMQVIQLMPDPLFKRIFPVSEVGKDQSESHVEQRAE